MECESAKNEIFHIGSDKEITIKEFVLEAGSFLISKEILLMMKLIQVQ